MPIDRVRALIRDVPDFPQAGIMFKDITPVLADAGAFQDVLDAMEARLRGRGFDRVVAILDWRFDSWREGGLQQEVGQVLEELAALER